jgi:HEAT repeat protein
MLRQAFEMIVTRPWLRIGVAVALIIAGLAPVGAPILSDNGWLAGPAEQTAEALTGTKPAAQPFVYRLSTGPSDATRIYRSDDGSQTWHEVAAIPQQVVQVEAVQDSGGLVFARSPQAIWISENGGTSWSRTTDLPSRPLSMVLVAGTPGLVFVGTESAGLLRSNDSGTSWQAVESSVLAGGGTAPVSVTALAINPVDEQIIYAATGVWLGTSQAHFTPLGVYASVDGGRQWFEMVHFPLGAAPVERLSPTPGAPLAVSVTDATGTHQVALRLDPDLLAALDDGDPGRRAAAARAIGLIGDRAALPALQRHLLDSNILAGDRIAEAIGLLGDATAVPSLVNALNSGDEAIQARSAYALGLLRAGEAVPELKRVLLTGGPMAQRGAAQALAAIGTSDAVAALLVPLGDVEMTPARHAAMAGLEVANTSAAGPLTAALKAPDPVLRANAAEALGWLRPATAAPALARALTDSEAAVRAQAAWALGEIGTPEARAALASALRSGQDTSTRDATSLALARAETTARGGRAQAIAPADALLGALTQVPASRWSFMVLAIALAVLLLWLGPHQVQPRRS